MNPKPIFIFLMANAPEINAAKPLFSYSPNRCTL
jgi:hypothetical protein